MSDFKFIDFRQAYTTNKMTWQRILEQAKYLALIKNLGGELTEEGEKFLDEFYRFVVSGLIFDHRIIAEDFYFTKGYLTPPLAATYPFLRYQDRPLILIKQVLKDGDPHIEITLGEKAKIMRPIDFENLKSDLRSLSFKAVKPKDKIAFIRVFSEGLIEVYPIKRDILSFFLPSDEINRLLDFETFRYNSMALIDTIERKYFSN